MQIAAELFLIGVIFGYAWTPIWQILKKTWGNIHKGVRHE